MYIEKLLYRFLRGEFKVKYKLPEDKNHLGLLVKFQKLKGKTLKGNELIKGNKDSRGLQPDKYVNYVHRLHDIMQSMNIIYVLIWL